MGKYKYLLWDVDGTVFDFHASEAIAIRTLFKKYGFGECTDEMIETYKTINAKYWQALERGEIIKSEVLTGRFREFFETVNLDATKAAEFNDDYQLSLGDTIFYCDDAKNLLISLKGRYISAAVTNGTKAAQENKLRNSGLDKVFDYIFISEEVGAEKPNVAFFQNVVDVVGIKNKSEALIIGDSLTSDIRGGNNIGIDTCWYNNTSRPKNIDVTVNYEIGDLHELLKII